MHPCGWLLLLSMMCLRFIHIIAYSVIVFLVAELCIPVCGQTTDSLPVKSSLGGHWQRFCYLAVKSKDAVKICAVSSCTCVFISLEYISRDRTAKWHNTCMFNLVRILETVFEREWPILHFHQQFTRVSGLYSCPHSELSFPFEPSWCAWAVSHRGFGLQFPDDATCEHLFGCLLLKRLSPCVRCLCQRHTVALRADCNLIL